MTDTEKLIADRLVALEGVAEAADTLVEQLGLWIRNQPWCELPFIPAENNLVVALAVLDVNPSPPPAPERPAENDQC